MKKNTGMANSSAMSHGFSFRLCGVLTIPLSLQGAWPAPEGAGPPRHLTTGAVSKVW